MSPQVRIQRMFPWTALLTAAVLASPGASANTNDTEPESAEVARRFDLRALDALAPPAYEGDPIPFRLLPLMRGPDWYDFTIRPFSESSDSSASEQLLAFFTDFESEGIQRADIVEPGVVLMVADAGTLAEFEKLVEFALRQVSELPVLSIRVLEPGITGAPTVVQEHRVVLPRRHPIHITDLVSHSVLTEVEVEVAQGSSASNAIVHEAQSGLDLILVGERVAGGLEVEYGVVETERVEAEFATPATSLLTVRPHQGRIQFDDSTSWEEQYAIEGGALAGTARINPNRPLTLRCGTERTIEIALAGPAPSAPELSVRLGDQVATMPDGTRFSSHHLEITQAARATPLGAVSGSVFSDWTSRATFGVTEGLLSAALGTEPTAQLMLLIELIDGAVPYELPFGDLIVAPAATLADITTKLPILSPEPSQSFRVALQRAGEAGEPNETFASADVLSGTECAFGIGREELIVKDMDVEVAQEASVIDPTVFCHFEGVSLSLELNLLPDGRVAYRGLGQVTLDEDVSAVPMPSSQAGDRTVTTTRGTLLDLRGIVALERGQASILLGDTLGEDCITLSITKLD